MPGNNLVIQAEASTAGCRPEPSPGSSSCHYKWLPLGVYYVQALSTHCLQYSRHLARWSLSLLTPAPQDTLHYTADLTLHPGHLSSCLISLLSLKPFHSSKHGDPKRFIICPHVTLQSLSVLISKMGIISTYLKGQMMKSCMFIVQRVMRQACNLSGFSGVIERPQGKKIWVVICHNRRGSGPRG